MNEQAYETPASELEEKEFIFSEVPLPKSRWFIFVWMLFGIPFIVKGIVFPVGLLILGEGQSELIQLLALVSSAFAFIAMFGVARLNITIINISIAVMAIGSASQAYNFVHAIINNTSDLKLIGFLFSFYTLPALLSCLYLARPSFKEIAKKHNQYKKYANMQKHAAKLMRK